MALHGSNDADRARYVRKVRDNQGVKNVIGPGGMRYPVTPDVERFLRSIDHDALHMNRPDPHSIVVSR